MMSKRSIAVWFGLIIICLGILYAKVIHFLIDDWINLPDFSHGFLIPMVSFYIVYEKRREWSEVIFEGQWSGLFWICLGAVFLLVGNLATEYFIMRLSLLVVLGGIILFLMGMGPFKILLFPLAYLFFMIPIPSIFLDRVTFPLQLFASKISADALHLAGIPALREGNIIQLANTSLEVAEACSGIRSLISLLALSVAFAYFSQKAFLKRLFLVLSTFPIAILANVARVGGTGFLAHFYGDSVAQGFFHSFSGWLLFVVAFLGLLGVSVLLSKFKDERFPRNSKEKGSPDHV
jgi:exosortase